MAILESSTGYGAGGRGLRGFFGPIMFAMPTRHICIDIEDTVTCITQEL